MCKSLSEQDWSNLRANEEVFNELTAEFGLQRGLELSSIERF